MFCELKRSPRTQPISNVKPEPQLENIPTQNIFRSTRKTSLYEPEACFLRKIFWVGLKSSFYVRNATVMIRHTIAPCYDVCAAFIWRLSMFYVYTCIYEKDYYDVIKANKLCSLKKQCSTVDVNRWYFTHIPLGLNIKLKGPHPCKWELTINRYCSLWLISIQGRIGHLTHKGRVFLWNQNRTRIDEKSTWTTEQ